MCDFIFIIIILPISPSRIFSTRPKKGDGSDEFLRTFCKFFLFFFIHQLLVKNLKGQKHDPEHYMCPAIFCSNLVISTLKYQLFYCYFDFRKK